MNAVGTAFSSDAFEQLSCFVGCLIVGIEHQVELVYHHHDPRHTGFRDGSSISSDIVTVGTEQLRAARKLRLDVLQHR